MEGSAAAHDPLLGSHGNASISTAGLPFSEESRRNPQDMSQSDPGERVGLFRRRNESE